MDDKSSEALKQSYDALTQTIFARLAKLEAFEASSTKEIATLKQDKDDLTQKLSVSDTNNAKLTQETGTVKKRDLDMIQQLKNSKNRNEELAKQLIIANEKDAEHIRQMNSFKSQLSDAEKNLDIEKAKNVKLNEQNAGLQTRLSDVDKKLATERDEKKKSAQKIGELEQQLCTLKKLNADHVQQMQISDKYYVECTNNLKAEHAQAISKITKEKDVLVVQLKDADDQVSGFQDQLNEIDKETVIERKANKEKIGELEQLLNKVRKEKDDFKVDLNKSEGLNAGLKHQVATSNDTISKLRQQLDDANSKLEAEQSRSAKVTEFSTQKLNDANDISKQNNGLKSRLDVANKQLVTEKATNISLNEQNAGFKRQLNNSNDTILKLRQQLGNVEKQLDLEKRNSAQKIGDLCTQLSSLKERNDEIKADMDILDDVNREVSKRFDVSKKLNADLKKQLKDSIKSNVDLNSQLELEKTEHRQMIDKLTAKLNDAEKQLEAKKSNNASKITKQLADTEKELEKENGAKQVNDLKSQLKSANEKIAEFNVKLTEVEEKNVGLQFELNTSANRITTLIQEKVSINSKLEEEQLKRSQLTECFTQQLNVAKENASNLAAQNNDAEKRNAALILRLEGSNKREEELKLQFHNATAQITTLTQELEASKAALQNGKHREQSTSSDYTSRKRSRINSGDEPDRKYAKLQDEIASIKTRTNAERKDLFTQAQGIFDTITKMDLNKLQGKNCEIMSECIVKLEKLKKELGSAEQRPVETQVDADQASSSGDRKSHTSSGRSTPNERVSEGRSSTGIRRSDLLEMHLQLYKLKGHYHAVHMKNQVSASKDWSKMINGSKQSELLEFYNEQVKRIRSQPQNSPYFKESDMQKVKASKDDLEFRLDFERSKCKIFDRDNDVRKTQEITAWFRKQVEDVCAKLTNEATYYLREKENISALELFYLTIGIQTTLEQPNLKQLASDWSDAAICYLDLDKRKSLTCYTEAIKCQPANATHYINRAKTLNSMREYEKALLDVNKALEFEPGSRSADKLKNKIKEKLAKSLNY